jgi:hypothetical protein
MACRTRSPISQKVLSIITDVCTAVIFSPLTQAASLTRQRSLRAYFSRHRLRIVSVPHVTMYSIEHMLNIMRTPHFTSVRQNHIRLDLCSLTHNAHHYRHQATLSPIRTVQESFSRRMAVTTSHSLAWHSPTRRYGNSPPACTFLVRLIDFAISSPVCCQRFV